MRFSALALSLLSTLPLTAETPEDIVRFLNGDLLHGRFKGISANTIQWKAPQAKNDNQYESNAISQIILREGHATRPLPYQPTAHLINGDELPGRIISLSGDELSFDSPLSGEVKIPKKSLARLQPNPHGGTLHYAGPYQSDGWLMPIHKSIEEPEPEQEAKHKEETAPWIYSGTAFYSKDTTPLVRNVSLPEKGRIRFKLGWRKRLNFSLAFHCDLTRPITPLDENNEEAEEQKKTLKFETLTKLSKGTALQQIPWLEPNNSNQALNYGTGYVLTLYSTYPSLYRCSFSDSGQAVVTNLRPSRSRTNLGENGEAEFDLRFNQAEKSIILYINGEYVAQWYDSDGYVGKGESIGLAANSQCKLRISDLRVTSWNGAQDSAVSMEHRERDIVLLTNGTDRFSGTVTGISENKLTLKGPYAEITLPLEDVADVRFAKNTLTKSEDIEWPANTALLHFQPLGRLSLSPVSATASEMEAKTPLFPQPLNIQLESATLLELNKTPHDLDEWFSEF